MYLEDFFVISDIPFWLCLLVSSMTCMSVCVSVCVIALFHLLRQDLAVYLWPDWTLLCGPGWPHTGRDVPTRASRVLGCGLVVPAQLTLTPPPGIHLYIFSLSSVTCVVNFYLELIIVGYFP